MLFLTCRDGAADGAKTVLDLAGWRGNWSLYAVLLGHFAARRDGAAKQAKSYLDDAAVRCDRSAWPYPVVNYLRGEIDEPKLLAAATDNGKMNEGAATSASTCFKTAKRTRPGCIFVGSRNTSILRTPSTRLPWPSCGGWMGSDRGAKRVDDPVRMASHSRA